MTISLKEAISKCLGDFFFFVVLFTVPMEDTVMCFFKDSCMKKCIRGILFPLMKSENSQQNDCEFRDEVVWLCTKAEVDLCKAEEMRNQKLQNSVRLPKRACKPGKNSLNPSCVLIRNEQLHSILWIAQCFWWNAKVELCVLWPPVVFCTWAAPSVRGAEINRNHSLMSFGVALLAFPLGKCRWVCLRLTWKRRDVQDTSGRWSAGQADAVTAWQICPWNNGCQCLDEHSVILQQFFFL